MAIARLKRLPDVGALQLFEGRKVLGLDLGALAQHHGGFQGVEQFTDVARPVVAPQHLQGGRADRFGRSPALIEGGDRVGGQQI